MLPVLLGLIIILFYTYIPRFLQEIRDAYVWINTDSLKNSNIQLPVTHCLSICIVCLYQAWTNPVKKVFAQMYTGQCGKWMGITVLQYSHSNCWNWHFPFALIQTVEIDTSPLLSFKLLKLTLPLCSHSNCWNWHFPFQESINNNKTDT